MVRNGLPLFFLVSICGLSVSTVLGQCLEVRTDFEGANPWLEAGVVRESGDRFRVSPMNEEGSNDAYYFRFNVKLVNRCEEERGVEFLVEWPALENHPDYPYDTYYYGTRSNWRWTYASIRGTLARLRIVAPEGVTFVGFYPRYSYAQLGDFLELLPDTPDLEKWVEGKSFQGRDLWALKITDSRVQDLDKQILLITARNHPYETSGSFIVEEMVEFLLGDNEKARSLRQNCVVYFMPMLNPDGVALGANQRTRPGGVNLSYGVETEDPAGTTLLDFVERIRPGLWADIHSWPHQGDDGLWATHQWVADGLLQRIPDGTLDDYVWNVSFVGERGTPDNHLWQWLIRTLHSGGVSLSMSWYRREEKEMEALSPVLLEALAGTLLERSR